jgi:hypothetical protein
VVAQPEELPWQLLGGEAEAEAEEPAERVAVGEGEGEAVGEAEGEGEGVPPSQLLAPGPELRPGPQLLQLWEPGELEKLPGSQGVQAGEEALLKEPGWHREH